MSPARHQQHPSPSTDYQRAVEDVLAPEDIHQARAVSEIRASNGLFIIFAIVLILAHAFNLYLFLGTGIWPIIPVILHIIISAIAAVITYGQYKAGMDVHHLSIMTIVSAGAGIFGAVGALLGLLSTLIFRAQSYVFEEWYRTIFPTDIPSDPETTYDRILEGVDENPKHYSVMPFSDVLRLGSENQKRRALAKMTSRFSPRFAPAFRMALTDSSNTIRVQAATAVAKVERSFSHKLERIELARAKDPQNSLLTMALAKFYDDYAFTGVLDPELEKLNRDRAIHTYKAYLQNDPNSADAWNAIGRLLFREEKWGEAAEWFRHSLDRGWTTNTTILWYFECLFRLGQFRELRRTLLEHGRGVVNQETLPPDVRQAVSMWMQVA